MGGSDPDGVFVWHNTDHIVVGGVPMSPGDQAHEGREAIASGRLLSLKERFNLSWAALASLIQVDATALKQWVAGDRIPTHEHAKKIGAWMLEVRDTIGTATLQYSANDLVPLSVASQVLGMSYATVLRKCQDRELTCVDLGGLGVYILKSDLRILREVA
jgi:transcriptional regulator with XRE-family HTH domain